MAKKLIITETELRKIIKEEIEKLKAENVKLKKELESKDQEKKSKGKA